MASRTLAQDVPNREAVNDRISGAQFQIDTLKQVLSSKDASLPHAESCVSAAVDQLLQAVTVALDGFNSMLPDPLPAQRVNRKNLRDQFYAVNAESSVLQSVDTAAHAGDGWLWFLEQKHDGAAFGHLLVKTGSAEALGYAVAKDPMNVSGGHESAAPADYLNSALDHVIDLLGDVAEKANDDVLQYRESQRRQARRLI